jgi:hypothetical protein
MVHGAGDYTFIGRSSPDPRRMFGIDYASLGKPVARAAGGERLWARDEQ